MLGTFDNLVVADSDGNGTDTDLQRARAKRRRLESKIGPRWNRHLSLLIDKCLVAEERLSEPARRLPA